MLTLLSCATQQDPSQDSTGAVDVYSIAWPESETGFSATGTWQTERRWDDQVSGISYEQGYAYWIATMHAQYSATSHSPSGARQMMATFSHPNQGDTDRVLLSIHRGQSFRELAMPDGQHGRIYGLALDDRERIVVGTNYGVLRRPLD